MFLLTLYFAISFSKCVNNYTYLGICDGYVIYPFWINDDSDKIVNANNNFIIDTWIKQLPIIYKLHFDTVPIQCAVTYPLCVQDKPVGICKSNCSNVLQLRTDGLRYDPCSLKIFQDDSRGQICTKIISSSASITKILLTLLILSVFI